MKTQKDIGKTIQSARKNKGLTQQELADRIGKNISSVRKYENGIVNIPTGTLVRIAEVLNISISNLIPRPTVADIMKLPESEQEKYYSYVDVGFVNIPTKAIIDKLLLLNDEGREKVSSYITDLINSKKYT